MVKKKISGQTIAIIILSILLLLAIIFGGVYAIYTTTTDRISGKIVMAVLNINFKVGFELESDKSSSSEVLISNGVYVPGETLKNTELAINNESNTTTYLVVVYKVNTEKEVQGYDDSKPLIDIGLTQDSDWVDYLYINETDSVRRRCLVCTTVQSECSKQAKEVVVIEKDSLKIPTSWGNGYQDMEISFSFQAFAVGERSFNFTTSTSREEKCYEIMNAIYEENKTEIIWK